METMTLDPSILTFNHRSLNVSNILWRVPLVYKGLNESYAVADPVCVCGGGVWGLRDPPPPLPFLNIL